MIQKICDLNLDMFSKYTTHTDYVLVQGDVGSNYFLINLQYKKSPMDLSNTTTTVTFKKLDGNKVKGSPEILNTTEGLIRYEVGEQEIAYAGMVEATVEVYDNEGRRLTSGMFSFEVRPQLDDGTAIESTTEYPFLTALMSAGADEINRVTAEGIRVSSEDTRLSNETARVGSEATRVTQENARKTAETSRVGVESARVTAENTRVSQENTRKTNETSRGTAEATRVTSETARTGAESTRATQESARVSTEAGRVTAENSRVSSENTRNTNETARGTAETSRSTVETARQTAETDRVSKESTRVSNDATRSSNEATRVSQESTRVTQETARVNAEGNATKGRVKAENDRVSAETVRVNSENTRSSQENTRQTNETARNTSESTRVNQETSRVTAEGDATMGRVKSENDRVSAEATRVSSESTRVSQENVRVSSENTRNTQETTRVNAEGDATKGRVKAENLRVTAESVRVTAESGRATAEGTRASSETTRGNNETTRQTNETNRVNAEGDATKGRVKAENLRVTAETARASSEATRATQETGRVDAEASRVSQEDARLASETARVSSESTRVSNESTRGTNETARVSAETTRNTQENTRKSNETARGTAETSRATAETNRVSVEGTRVTAETARASAEASRVTVESTRVTAESGRASAESTRVTQENARKTAETARGTAETTRQTQETSRQTNTTSAIGRLDSAVDSTVLVWKPAVATYVNIATTYPSPALGWRVETNDTKRVYRYDGSTWVHVSDGGLGYEAENLAKKGTANGYAPLDANSKVPLLNLPSLDYAGSTHNHDASYAKLNQVLTDVPAGAKFTDTVTTVNGKTGAISKADIVALGVPAQDTVYSHPATHPASMITGLPTSLPANGGHSATSGGIIGDDTRSSDYAPSVYMVGGSRYKGLVGWQTEFKGTATIGVTGFISGTYCYLETKTPWTDPSGGYPIQIAYGNGTPCYRVGTSTTAWGAWSSYMPSDLKTKIDGIESGANNYTHPASHPATIVVQDASNRFVTDSEKSTWNAKQGSLGSGTTAQYLRGDGTWATPPDTNTTYAVATTGANGLMSSTDKAKLDGVATGANNYSHPANHPASVITQDASNRFVTDAEKTAWNAKQVAITGGATTIATSNLTASMALVSDASGKVAVSAVTSTEVGYLDGVTSAIQTQLNGKAPTSHSHSATDLTSGVVPDARLSGLYSGFTHKIDGANTVFTTPSAGSTTTDARTVFGLAEYKSSGSAQVGAIVFIAPNVTSSIMYQFSIAGMLYNQDIFTMELQGYRTTGAWNAIKKVSTGTVDIQTRFGVTPDGKNCIILGDVGTVWSYPHISIVRALLSHSGATDAVASGWTTAIVTNLSTYTNVSATITDSPVIGAITGNAGTATKLATARTLSLTGDVTGSVSFDGSANASITTTIADDSHNHVIANVDGLQTALDAKSPKSTTLAGYGITDGVTYAEHLALSNLVQETYSPLGHTHDYVPLSRTVNGKALSANIAITEADMGTVYGYTANGHYKKFEDGTLICWATKTFSTTVSLAWGSFFYHATQNWTFPVAFVGDKPVCTATCTDGGAELMGMIPNSTLTNIIFYGMRPTSVPASTSFTYKLSAIGRWKA